MLLPSYPCQFLALFLGLPTSISISSSNCEGGFFFFKFATQTPVIETGQRPLNSCPVVTVMFIRSNPQICLCVAYKVPKSYIARHLAAERVSLSLVPRLALEVLLVHGRLILGAEVLLNCYLLISGSRVAAATSGDFLCQDYGQTKIQKELPDLRLGVCFAQLSPFSTWPNTTNRPSSSSPGALVIFSK